MTTPTLILGVDPGANGALAFYSPSPNTHPHQAPANLTITDIPSTFVKLNGKQSLRIDIASLSQIIDTYSKSITFAVVEDVHSSPMMGVASSFNFGFSAGIIQGILAANFIPIKKIRPAAWKKELNLTHDKNATRKRASEIWPQFKHLWPLAKHDGRAEAALLALLGERIL